MSAISLSECQDQIINSNFAILDYIPFISTYSGYTRIIFGTFQTGIGVFCFPEGRML
jgi:hypothetical protein